MFLYHWTTPKAWKRIQKQGLRPSKPSVRLSPVGVPYKIVGRKIWLCDGVSIFKFQEHLEKIKGEKPTILLMVYVDPMFLIPYRPMQGAYFVRFAIPRPFIQVTPLTK